MTPVLDAPTALAPRPCPECLTAFDPVDAGQLFCCTPHRRAWNNRWVTRGAVIAPLAAIARVTRNGTRGTDAGRRAGWRAGREVDALIARYRREDAAANDGRGRMSWEEWLVRRYDAGFDPV